MDNINEHKNLHKNAVKYLYLTNKKFPWKRKSILFVKFDTNFKKKFKAKNQINFFDKRCPKSAVKEGYTKFLENFRDFRIQKLGQVNPGPYGVKQHESISSSKNLRFMIKKMQKKLPREKSGSWSAKKKYIFVE